MIDPFFGVTWAEVKAAIQGDIDMGKVPDSPARRESDRLVEEAELREAEERRKNPRRGYRR